MQVIGQYPCHSAHLQLAVLIASPERFTRTPHHSKFLPMNESVSTLLPYYITAIGAMVCRVVKALVQPFIDGGTRWCPRWNLLRGEAPSCEAAFESP